MARDDNQQGASSTSDRGGADADEHVVSDEHGTRATGPAAGSSGTGIERLGGLPGGTPNYGGVGSPGGAGSHGQGRANASDTAEGGRGGQRNGAETGGHVERGSSGTPGPQVLANGGTRADGGAAGTAGAHSAGDTDGEDDALALARQAGQNAMDHGPSSTGGTLQRPRTSSRDTTDTTAAGGAGSDAQATTASPAADTASSKSEGTSMRNHDPALGPPVNPDEVSGSGMGAAANDADRGGAEAATASRSGGGATVGGSPPPAGAPPAPITPDPYGGTISESHADPGFPPPVPEQPTPGLTREPGPEAQT